MKRILITAIVFFIALSGLQAAFLTAVDITPGEVTSTVDYDGVRLIGTEGKSITVEELGDNPREAADGEVFNARIKLNGGGSASARAIAFTAEEDGTELTVYLNSSSKTDERTLVVAAADGTIIGTITAPPDVDGIAGMGTITLPKAGEYMVYSKSSGINIYMLYC